MSDYVCMKCWKEVLVFDMTTGKPAQPIADYYHNHCGGRVEYKENLGGYNEE